MGKSRTRFVCSNCGREEPKWLGRCPDCGEWNVFKEASVVPGTRAGSGAGGSARRAGSRPSATSMALGDIAVEDEPRWSSGMLELDRVLGGGIVPGASVLVGGEPGIGKSTLMMQAAAIASIPGRRVYVSGEESPTQLKMRARRLGLVDSAMQVLPQTDLQAVQTELERIKPNLVVIDSIQTMFTPEAGNVPGTVNQIRYCAHELIEWARDHGAALFLVAHVTKEGTIAGPKILEHMVDTVLYFEQSGDEVRFLRGTKNRFGSTDDVGLFTMQPAGLIQVADPSSLFLVRRDRTLPSGVVVAPVYEGTRILLVEIQALTVPAKGGISRTFSDRIDSGRVQRVSAVLEKHVGLRFSDQDLYVNVAGGIRITEVGVELPLALALYSARTGIPFSADLAVTGEVSLAGEVRPISALFRRILASEELGFPRCIGPAAAREAEDSGSVEWIRVSSITEAVRAAFGEAAANRDGATNGASSPQAER